MNFLYIILIIIAIVVYLIYKKINPSVISKERATENIQAQIIRQEEMLSKHIDMSHLKDYIQQQAIMFDCGKRNFIRLSERFKHDDIKLTQVVKDWTDYMEILQGIIYEQELLDVSTAEGADEHFDNMHELAIKIQEIEKRFKGLLGKEYEDPEKLMLMKLPPKPKYTKKEEKEIDKKLNDILREK